MFFDDVRVPAENRLGEEGQGWKVAMATAGSSAASCSGAPRASRRPLPPPDRAIPPQKVAADPVLRDAVVRAWMDAEAYALNTYWTASRLIAGGTIGAEASLNKIFWSEMDVRMHETALALLGPHAELLAEAPASADCDGWLDGFLFSLAGPIYAGTNEIQRNVIAERLPASLD